MGSSSTMTLPAPAKLNLFLHVTGRRADGYHQLETLLVADRSRRSHHAERARRCADRSRTRPRRRRRERRSRRARGAPAATDLRRRRAASASTSTSAFRWAAGSAAAAPTPPPSCSGSTGCGSSASRVRALMALALELGADVPFFVFGAPAFARGIGEVLEPVSLPPTWFVVAMPPVQVATAAIFAAPELTRNSAPRKYQSFPKGTAATICRRLQLRGFRKSRPVSMRSHARRPARRRRHDRLGGVRFRRVFRRKPRAAGAGSSWQRAGRAAFVARALEHPLRRFAAP